VTNNITLVLGLPVRHTRTSFTHDVTVTLSKVMGMGTSRFEHVLARYELICRMTASTCCLLLLLPFAFLYFLKGHGWWYYL